MGAVRHHKDLPEFDDLPAVEGMPAGCAWGIFDKDGIRDQIGTINLLTPDVVLEANRSEVKTGISVALNWAMHNTSGPGFGRKPLEHRIIDWRSHAEYFANDDEIAINTQAGSQWDGLKHWGHQSTGTYYNGQKHSDCTRSLDNGIHHWTSRGGFVGRGVLIDWVAYADRHKLRYNPWERHEIPIEELEDAAREQGTEFKPADILIVRSGWVKHYNNATVEEREKGVKTGHTHIGVKAGEATIRWLWKKKFAAIAGDTIAWEAWPPSDQDKDWVVHDWSLAMAGRPIGELWNLEELAAVCAREERWSFFFVSAPLNVEGGVASPPNALAIF